MGYIEEMALLNPDSYLLPGNSPDKPYDNRQIGRDFNKMLEIIGIDEQARKERGIVFHSWRHFIAKNLAETTTSRQIGMKILGHKTSRMFDHYANHTDKETFKMMAGALEKSLKPEKPIREPIPFKGVV
jgi:integrase